MWPICLVNTLRLICFGEASRHCLNLVPAVVFSTDANYWGAVHVSPNGHYAMMSPLPDALPIIVENVLHSQSPDNPSRVPNCQIRMEG